ncbi:hypothetical protein KY084_13405 [Stakelama sp. CBK3Z-3]|uniref:Uncharacterized protein n=1 Tax=Stakelama flava TaxID=2860338 RepID=A0ABS6XNR7_9SPHN|nr:hypothetical protein [Stakelama flava]MBW4331865.1 hypothetical protein [Stakelama flava]
MSVRERARFETAQPLLARHAISPAEAEPFAIPQGSDRAAFDYMRDHAIIREAKPGHYYVDVAAFDADIAALRRRRSWLWLGVALTIALVALAFYR